jgi:hypothetical protein
MGGREWRGSPIRPRAASDVFSRVVATLEEPCTATAEEVSGRQNRGREGRHRGEGIGVVFSSLFVQWNGPGGAVGDGGGGIVMDLVQRPWTAADEGERNRICTLAFLFRSSAGGTVHDVGGQRQGFE